MLSLGSGKQMLEDAKSHLAKRARELDLGRADTLAKIQTILDEAYRQKAVAKSLNNGVLKVVTPSAGIASEVRLNQVSLIKQILRRTSVTVDRLYVQIGELA